MHSISKMQCTNKNKCAFYALRILYAPICILYAPMCVFYAQCVFYAPMCIFYAHVHILRSTVRILRTVETARAELNLRITGWTPRLPPAISDQWEHQFTYLRSHVPKIIFCRNDFCEIHQNYTYIWQNCLFLTCKWGGITINKFWRPCWYEMNY